MSLPDQTPKLPKLPFLIGDACLLALAGYIIAQSQRPLSAAEITAAAVCVGLAAVIGAIPFLADYARKQDEALDERHRSLEALSQTIASAAEQISIAASGLHQITEIAHKNLKQAEQLPHKLQEKISEFNAQLDNARDDDREELEKELAELRASESDRLAASTDKIHKTVAELTKLDASLHQHLTARVAPSAEDRAQLQAQTTAAIREALASASRDLAAAQTKALADFESRLGERTAALLTAVETATKTAAVANPPATSPTAQDAAPLPPTEPPSPPKRPRKTRRDEATPSEATSPHAASEETAPEAPIVSSPSPEASPPQIALSSPSSVPAPDASTTAAVETPPPPATVEPAPIAPPAPAQLIEPVVPDSADPFPSDETAPEPAAADVGPVEERAPKKRAPRKADRDATADLPLELDGLSLSPDADEHAERVLSSDGATRLIATAYIGIGNRLFIRGDGPGLNWEKGIPLQFISIGKWRWETADAAAPIRFKLYKNDDVECSALGERVLDPGHQQEVTARF